MITRAKRMAEAAAIYTPGRRSLGERLAQIAEERVRSGIGMHEFEFAWRRAILKAALEFHKWNQLKAAAELQMHRNTLSRAIEECGLKEDLRRFHSAKDSA